MSQLISAVTSLFTGKADAPPPAHHILQNGEVNREVAPDAAQIAQQPQFPSGPSRSTSLDIEPEPPAHDTAITAAAAAAAASSPAASSDSLPAVLGRRTAPTVFITAETASSAVAPFPLITVGPVIGLVTATTARVLIECNTSMTVNIRITQTERDVRKTRHAAAAESAAAPAVHANGDSPSVSFAYPPAVTTQEAAILTGASSGSPVNAAFPASSSPASTASTASASTASEPASSPDALRQQAAILTGSSSGSPVSSAAFAFSDSPVPSQHSSNGSSRPVSQASPGTTVGDAASSQVEGATSTEKRPAPATQPSPSELPQSEGKGGAQLLSDTPASTFAPMVPTSREQEQQAAVMQKQAAAAAAVPPPLPDAQVLEKAVECTQHRVATITFTDLQPDSRYELSFLNVKSRVPSSFTTLIDNWPASASAPFSVAFVSCNLLSVTKDLALPDSDLWLDLSRRVAQREIDYVLHIGDQIYADEKRDLSSELQYQLVFKTGVEMLRPLPSSDWPTCAVHIKELYRQLYRETWSHPPTASVLANAPSLMIYDDHDFRDDWGNEPEDSDPESLEYYVGRCAHEVMCEYQRQLWDNVDFSRLTDIKKDFHFHVFGQHGLMFLDVRGPRSLHKLEGEKYPYMGSLQWEEVKAALSEGGVMRDVRSLLMICPAPIVFLPTAINDLLGHSVIDDALGHWSSVPFKAEQQMMLNLCQAWKAARAGRELTFIGGDVHVGGHSEILRDGCVVFQQFVTSAISNYRLSRFEFLLGQISQDLITTLDDGWSFKHRGFTRQRNYGLMTVSSDDTGPLVRRRLVTPKGEKPEADNRRGTAHLK